MHTWKGLILPSSVSYATTSLSNMKLVTPELMAFGSRWIMSGYLVVWFSEFRLYTAIYASARSWDRRVPLTLCPPSSDSG